MICTWENQKVVYYLILNPRNTVVFETNWFEAITDAISSMMLSTNQLWNIYMQATDQNNPKMSNLDHDENPK